MGTKVSVTDFTDVLVETSQLSSGKYATVFVYNDWYTGHINAHVM